MGSTAGKAHTCRHPIGIQQVDRARCHQLQMFGAYPAYPSAVSSHIKYSYRYWLSTVRITAYPSTALPRSAEFDMSGLRDDHAIRPIWIRSRSNGRGQRSQGRTKRHEEHRWPQSWGGSHGNSSWWGRLLIGNAMIRIICSEKAGDLALSITNYQLFLSKRPVVQLHTDLSSCHILQLGGL